MGFSVVQTASKTVVGSSISLAFNSSIGPCSTVQVFIINSESQYTPTSATFNGVAGQLDSTSNESASCNINVASWVQSQTGIIGGKSITVGFAESLSLTAFAFEVASMEFITATSVVQANYEFDTFALNTSVPFEQTVTDPTQVNAIFLGCAGGYTASINGPGQPWKNLASIKDGRSNYLTAGYYINPEYVTGSSVEYFGSQNPTHQTNSITLVGLTAPLGPEET